MRIVGLNKTNKIIVRMPNWLGDLVMATPVLADLRTRYPKANITAMCQHNVAALLQEDPNIDEIFAFTKPSGWLRRDESRDIIARLRQGDYDLGVLLTNSLSSAWWFYRGRVRERVGYPGHYRRWLLSECVSYPTNLKEQHLVLTYKQLVERFGPGAPATDSLPTLYLSEAEKQSVAEHLHNLEIEPEATVVGINPGAAYGSAKCWLPERFEAVCHKLLENKNIRILFFGNNAGAPLVAKICAQLPSHVVDLAGKTTIRELMAYIQACDIFLTNDSGPMHMAAALGTPLLALFGSTCDVRTGPYGVGEGNAEATESQVIHKHVSCSPCYKRTCPIDFRCMKSIEVGEVYKSLRDMIEKKP